MDEPHPQAIEAPEERSRKCIYCDDWAASQEDLLPMWIDNTFQFPSDWSHGKAVLTKAGKTYVPQDRIATKQTAVKCVCERCNNGWMSQLETDVKPILAPMINGYRTRLTQSDQLVLARWASLKAQCFDANPRGPVPSSSSDARLTVRGGDSVLEAGRPPDRWAVFLGAYERAGHFGIYMPFVTGMDAQGNYAGVSFTTTLVLNHTVLVVQGRTGGHRPPPLLEMPGGYNLAGRTDGSEVALISIWPPRPNGFEWPPTQSMTTEHLVNAVRLGIPDEAISDDFLEQQEGLRNHANEAHCSTCGSNHGSHPTVALPLEEPDDWRNRAGL